MEQHFMLMVQCVGAGVVLGLICLVLGYGLDRIARVPSQIFKP